MVFAIFVFEIPDFNDSLMVFSLPDNFNFLLGCLTTANILITGKPEKATNTDNTNTEGVNERKYLGTNTVDKAKTAHGLQSDMLMH
jgi:hypothetical protein